MRAEQEILRQARHAFAKKKLDAALRELDRHARLYPNSAFASERGDLKQQVTAALATQDGPR